MDTIRSTDDRRTAVSGIRHTYRMLDDKEKQAVDEIKTQAQELWDTIDAWQESAWRPGQARSYALAKTKVEEAVMWATHGITCPEPQREHEGEG